MDAQTVFSAVITALQVAIGAILWAMWLAIGELNRTVTKQNGSLHDLASWRSMHDKQDDVRKSDTDRALEVARVEASVWRGEHARFQDEHWREIEKLRTAVHGLSNEVTALKTELRIHKRRCEGDGEQQ